MKRFLCILIFVLIGLFLRLIFIDKPDGLWNDEIVSWSISVLPFGKVFFKGILSQCHMPFYYLYLKFFIYLFNDSDLVLRLSSVFAGILAIPVMYLVGKEYDDKTGYYCAGFTTISSFLIYYSQEVRLYSLLFLISSCSLLYTFRLIKNVNFKNSILYVLFNVLILFTHTIGFVYVFLSLVVVMLNLYKTFKKQILCLIYCLSGAFCLFVPFILKIFFTKSFSQWWGHFSFSKIGFLFTDYFSPILTNLTNAPDNFFYAPNLIFLMLLPSIIIIFFVIISLKDSLNRYLFSLCCFFIFILLIASITGKLIFITKYTIEIYPILIYLACFGASSVNNKILKRTLIIIYCIISAGYILISPNSAPKMHRSEGNKIPMEMIKFANLNKGDYIILQYYPPQRFEKYFDFSNFNVISMDKGNFVNYISPIVSYDSVYRDGKSLYKNIFIEKENKYLENILNKKISLQTGSSVLLVVMDSVSFYRPEELEAIVKNDTLYRKTPFLFLVFSYLKKETFEYLISNYSLAQIQRKGMWTVVKFTKLNNK